MENGKLKIWLPTLRTGTGAEIFSKRMATALNNAGLCAHVSLYSHYHEPFPSMLRWVSPPPGTDIIMANSWNGFAFKRHNLPLIVTVHHAAFNTMARQYQSFLQRLYHDKLIRPYEIRSIRIANAVTAVSDFAASSVASVSGRGDVLVLPNWVDTHRFHPIANPHPTNQPFRLLYVGKSSSIKGCDLLFPIMQKLGVDFELLIAGRWPRRPLPKNAQVLGWLDEAALIEQYQTCDALLFPTRFEGFGYAALEAMACGKPVIASNSSALPELVKPGMTGLLCPMDDVDAFVDACRTLAHDPDRCAYMGAAGRNRAIQSFSEHTVIPLYLELIRNLAQTA